MNHPNKICGAEQGLGTGMGEMPTASENICNGVLGQSTGYRDRTPTIEAVLELRADYNFSTALSCAISGQRITRAGWNGRGQYVSVQNPDKNSRMTAPYLVLKNNRGDLVPWVPSQGDLFARDWAVIPIQPV